MFERKMEPKIILFDIQERKIFDLLCLNKNTNIILVNTVSPRLQRFFDYIYNEKTYYCRRSEVNNFVTSVVKDQEFPLIIPTEEATLKVLSLSGAEQFKKRLCMSLDDFSLHDKFVFYQFCQQHSIATPKTAKNLNAFLSRNEVNAVIAKPTVGSGARGHFIGGLDEVRKFSAQHDKNYIYQEYMNFKFVVGFNFIRNIDGDVFYYMHKRILTPKESGGVTLASEIYYCPECERFGLKFMSHVKSPGFYMLEIGVSDVGQLFAIELNPRIWGSIKLATALDVNPLDFFLGYQKGVQQKKPALDRTLIVWPLGLIVKPDLWLKLGKIIKDSRAIVTINFSKQMIIRSLAFGFLFLVLKLFRK